MSESAISPEAPAGTRAPAVSGLSGSTAPRESGAAEKPQLFADPAVHGVMARYWNTLGIHPTDDRDALEASFFLVVEGLSRNPTEEDEKKRDELERCYQALCRALDSRPPIVATFRFDESGLTSRQRVGAGIAASISLAALVYFNFGTLKLQWVEIAPGTVVRLAGGPEPYGTVIGFDAAHKFAVGAPTRAYQIQLSGTDEIVWLSERIVEKGMLPAK